MFFLLGLFYSVFPAGFHTHSAQIIRGPAAWQAPLLSGPSASQTPRTGRSRLVSGLRIHRRYRHPVHPLQSHLFLIHFNFFLALTYVRPGKFVRSTEIAVPCNIHAGTRLIGSRTTKAVIEWFVANGLSHMNSIHRRICTPLIALFLSLLPEIGFSHPVISVIVSPASASNTYSGSVTVHITGLTNGEQVAVQKYLDLNGNHRVDAKEPLVSAFNITDGGTAVIGGITNINAIYDTDGTAGAITAALGFAEPRSLENMVGQYLFRVASPTANFIAVTNVFSVTNAGRQGKIHQDAGERWRGRREHRDLRVYAIQSGGRDAGADFHRCGRCGADGVCAGDIQVGGRRHLFHQFIRQHRHVDRDPGRNVRPEVRGQLP
jgi:hypothetical protein